MKKFSITKSKRLRSTPFSSRIEAQGVKSYSVYNHMLLPTVFDSFINEYHHLKTHVQVWDVSVQREIEIIGKDSYTLVQLMTCRDLSKAKIKKCYYSPLIDKYGKMINDPLIYKIDNDTWRICIADSDVMLFAKGIAEAKNLNVDIKETNISTLAVQGPKSIQLMEKIFGSKIKELKFFNYDYFEFDNHRYLISKSGYSKQGGFEIHVENIKAGLKLYDHMFKVGKEFNIKAGCPNIIERIEGGLLSYGNDMDIRDNPFECGFDKYINLDADIDFLGKDSLNKIKSNGIVKKLMGVKINTQQIDLYNEEKLYDKNNNFVGFLRSAVYSPNFKKVVGIAMIEKKYCKISQEFKINIDGKQIFGEICNLPLL